MTNDRMKRIAARMRDTVQESDLADALAALDARGGFGKLSYQEQATFLLAHIGGIENDRPAPTERSHVTPIGDGIGVKPLGSPNPEPEPAVIIASLNDRQIDALRYVAAEERRYRGKVVVSRHLNKSSARALERRGLLVSRMNPSTSWGFALTERGKAVAGALNSPPYRRP